MMLKYLNYIIYWSMVIIPFSISIAPALTYTFMGFLFIGFILKKIILILKDSPSCTYLRKGLKEKLFVNTAVNLPFLILAFISVISFRNTIDYYSSAKGIMKLLQNIFMVLICAEEIKDRRHITRVILSIVLGASLASFDGLWQIIFGKDFIRGNAPILNIGLKRATAAFPNANVFGAYLSAITPLIAGLAFYYYKGKSKLIMLGASLLSLSGVVISFSRGTGLAIYLSLLFISILIGRNKITPVILILILLISPILMPKEIKSWAKGANYNPLAVLFNTDRASIYKNTMNMIYHHPFIGVGVNTFSKNYLRYKLPEPNDARTSDYMYAHNNFLQMAGEIGLLGISVFFWLLYRFFKKSFAIYRMAKDNLYKVISLSISAGILSYLINGLTETTLYYSRVAMIFWFLMGFALALEKLANDTQSQQS